MFKKAFCVCTIIISKSVILPANTKESSRLTVCLALGFCCRIAVPWRLGEECLCLCALLREKPFPFTPTPTRFPFSTLDESMLSFYIHVEQHKIETLTVHCSVRF